MRFTVWIGQGRKLFSSFHDGIPGIVFEGGYVTTLRRLYLNSGVRNETIEITVGRGLIELYFDLRHDLLRHKLKQTFPFPDQQWMHYCGIKQIV